ncbi:MAG: heme exporter protein CcmD [Chromatiales bacterium]|nr:heme exporter protein CcmD [Chromatiales bacterium]
MSIGEFFDMGGYALYVWSSFGVTALLMVIEPVLLRGRRQAIKQRIARIVRMNAEEKA